MALTPAVIFSAGYGFASATDLESEVRQGKNYLLASLYQVSQIYNLSTINYVCLQDLAPSHLKTVANICNQLAPWVSAVFCPLAAKVKQSDNSSEKWSRHSIRIFHFIANHTSHIATAGMLTATAAQYILAGPYYAGALATPVLFQVSENLNLVPRRVSRFVESTMPLVTSVTYAMGGSQLNRVISAVSLMSFIPSAGIKMQHILDRMNHYFTPKGKMEDLSPWTLAELEAPLVLPENLSFSKMRTLLAANQDQFEPNPKHFTKPTGIALEPSKKYDTNILLDMFKETSIFKNWDEKIERRLINQLADDERFIDFLKEQFPNESDFRKNCRILIIKLATKTNASEKNDSMALQLYLKALLIKQMQQCVDVLTNKQKAKGSATDILEAQTLCQVVIEYLINLKSSVECEDILIKIAIEGGGYCARAIKRVFTELREPIICYKLQSSGDPLVLYELQILYALEKQRHRLADAAYLQYIEQLVSFITLMNDRNGHHPEETSKINATSLTQAKNSTAVKIAADIHIGDIYRKNFALGFAPLSQQERNSVRGMDVYMWGSFTYPFRKFRKLMFNAYDTNAAISEVGSVRLTDYLQRKIGTSVQLTQSEKEKLIDILINGDDNRWPLEQSKERFQRLILYMLGVLRLKSTSTVNLAENPADWQFYQLDREFEHICHSDTHQKSQGDFKSDEEDWIMLAKPGL
jgi:hypothetical protein